MDTEVKSYEMFTDVWGSKEIHVHIEAMSKDGWHLQYMFQEDQSAAYDPGTYFYTCVWCREAGGFPEKFGKLARDFEALEAKFAELEERASAGYTSIENLKSENSRYRTALLKYADGGGQVAADALKEVPDAGIS